MHHWNHLIHTVNVTGLMSGKESLGTKGGWVGGRMYVCVCVWMDRLGVCMRVGGYNVCVCVCSRNGANMIGGGQGAAPCSYN